MPVIATPEGWVRVAAVNKKKAKPADPLAAYRGPLAYITGRSDIKGPPKRPQIPQQLTIEPARPQPRNQRVSASATSPFDATQPARPRRPRPRIPSAKTRETPTDTFEVADEEILRSDLHNDARSQRSASPTGTRHSRSLRTRGDDYSRASRPCRDDRVDHKYHEHRSDRRYRMRDDHEYAAPPTLQPIVIYATPPVSSSCGGFHHSYVHSCQVPLRSRIQALPQPDSRCGRFPQPTPSVTSSRSSDSKASRALSYQWYNATQPLNI